MTGRKQSMYRGALAALAAWFTVSAGAVTPGAGGFSWSFQDTGVFSSGGGSVVAMRNGAVFPVVFNDFGGVAGQYSSGWIDLTNAIGPDPFGSALRASSGSDGRIAVVGDSGGVVSVLPFNGLSILPDVPESGSGFANVPIAADFGASGGLVTASDFDVSGRPEGFFSGDISDVAVSVNGDIAVVTDSGRFYEYNNLVGTWFETNLGTLSTVGSFFGEASLTYDSLGRAHVVVDNGSDLVAADFNPQTGTFEFDIIASPNETSFNDVAANAFGVVGTSYIDNGTLFYAYKEGTGDWASVAVTTTFASQDQTGITFDHEGLPVLSYNSGSSVWIAYDPIVVPEPAAATLMGLVALGVLRRRRA